MVDKISGVDSFSIFNYNNKMYYMFGDIHGKLNKNCDVHNNCDYFDYKFEKVKIYNTNCTTITPLLYMWFLYNNDYHIKTDFYFESTFTKSDEHGKTNYTALIDNMKKEREKEGKVETLTTIAPVNVSWLELSISLFLSCLVKDKTKCMFYPNIHFHYIDIRRFKWDNVSPFDVSFLLDYIDPYKINLTQLEDIHLIIDSIKDNYRLILAGIVGEEYDEMIDFLKSIPIQDYEIKQYYLFLIDNYNVMTVMREGKKIHRVAAEVRRLKKENNYIYNHLINYINDYKINFVKYNTKSIIKYIEYYDNLFLTISSFTFDVYLLARMFIQQDSEQIITYTGVYHHINCSKFFQHYLHIKPIFEAFYEPCIEFKRLPYYLNVNEYRHHYLINY